MQNETLSEYSLFTLPKLKRNVGLIVQSHAHKFLAHSSYCIDTHLKELCSSSILLLYTLRVGQYSCRDGTNKRTCTYKKLFELENVSFAVSFFEHLASKCFFMYQTIPPRYLKCIAKLNEYGNSILVTAH